MMTTIRLLACAFFCFILAPVRTPAQVIENVDPKREADFFYQVKILDEFFERFNDDPTSELRKAYTLAGKKMNFNRRDLIGSLFESTSYATEPLAKQFIDKVTDASNPFLLSFNDSNWYVELNCTFLNQGKEAIIPLVLQINTSNRKAIKWMIAGIGEHAVFSQEIKPALSGAKRSSVRVRAIPPADYGTNFLELHHILSSGINPPLFFQPEVLASDRGKKFAAMLSSGQLTLVHTGKMTYYFFQIPGYMFTVEQFLRNTRHSGWLISSLAAVDEAQKQKNIKGLLRRSPKSD